jgi:hypothetical protein
MFSSFKPDKIPIKTGSLSDLLLALGVGTVTALVGGKVLKLDNCLYVPTISQQLISLVRLIQSSITIDKNNAAFTISQGSETMFSGNILDNLLYVTYSSPLALFSRSKFNHTTWHH